MTISPVLALTILTPQILQFSIVGVAAFVAFRLSRQRQSHELFLVSVGLLVYLILNGSWTLIYWAVLGGPFGVINLSQAGRSTSEIQGIISLIYWTSTAISAVSWAVMVYLIIYGVSKTGQARLVPFGAQVEARLAPIAFSAHAIPSSPGVCANCGHTNPEKQVFCSNCARPISETLRRLT